MKIWIFYLVVVNGVAFCLYGLDKWKAIHHKWRISENILFLSAILGGSMGALFGMYAFHHKTKHKKFIIGIPCILVIQILLLAWSLYQQ